MVAILFLLLLSSVVAPHNHNKRALQKSHEKPQKQKWMESFFGEPKFDQVLSLVKLIKQISQDYLTGCTPIILYDNFAEMEDNLFLEQLFRDYPLAYVHGQITSNYKIKVKNIIKNQKTCVSYILVLQDVMRCREVIGDQNVNKVVVVSRSSQWRVFEFLSNERSQNFANILVIVKSDKAISIKEEAPYILYTHKLYVDALGASQPQVLTSWIRGNLTRTDISLFPRKLLNGFAGHRFIIAVAHQPPFVIKLGRNENDEIEWEGIDLRLINILSKVYNFTSDFRETREDVTLGSSEAVVKQVYESRADLGAAGLYTTVEKISKVGMSAWHSQDCGSFVTLTSLALPRYRAIMGPFHWTVWLALTCIYLLGIFPIAFSEKHTIKHLFKKPEEIENMFWYVFGTFTNCFTFTGEGSWGRAEKVTTKIFVGFYWIFTIIITACYTGSIIAFVTLPVYPTVTDTAKQLVSGRYQVGTLDKGGWQYWFLNSSDKTTSQLLKNLELVPTVEAGLKNTTKAFFWPYAFLASRAQLNFIVRSNFSTTNKRSLLHISKECFVQFNVGLVYRKNSIYQEIINRGINNAVQAGLIEKIRNDIDWKIMRSATGKLLAANSKSKKLNSLNVEDRALTLDDTQGMFLLLGIGFVLGGACLISEWFGGCFNICKKKRKNSSSTISSNPRSHENLTPREKIDSIQYNNSLQLYRDRMESIGEFKFNRDDDNLIENVEDTPRCIIHVGEQQDEKSVDYEQEIDHAFMDVFGESTKDHNGQIGENDLLDSVDNKSDN